MLARRPHLQPLVGRSGNVPGDGCCRNLEGAHRARSLTFQVTRGLSHLYLPISGCTDVSFRVLSTRKASSRSWLRPSTPHIAGQTGRERDKPPIKLSQGNPPSFRGTPGQGRSPSLGSSAKYLALGILEQRKGVPSKGRTQRQRPQAEVKTWMSGRQGHPGTICKGDARETMICSQDGN